MEGMKRLLAFAFLPVLLLADGASGLSWKTPAAWKALPERPMRAATYSVPGTPEAGECAVFYFGPGQGGAVEPNITRWESQFPTKSSPTKRTAGTVAGHKTTYLDLSGTYAWSPSPMSQEKVMKPDYRMLGAIVEAPNGSVFFKFTGPAKVVAAQEAAFKAMIQGITK
jgi:hypothetical protein